MRTSLTITKINRLDRADFVAALGFVFEGPPWIVERAWDDRPFGDVAGLHERLCAAMYGAPKDRQVALLRAHPDLVGRAALAGTLTPESMGEQASAGLDRLSAEEVALFTRLNRAYHDAFGFPFVICVRQNKKEGILAGFDARPRAARAPRSRGCACSTAGSRQRRPATRIAWQTTTTDVICVRGCAGG